MSRWWRVPGSACSHFRRCSPLFFRPSAPLRHSSSCPSPCRRSSTGHRQSSDWESSGRQSKCNEWICWSPCRSGADEGAPSARWLRLLSSRCTTDLLGKPSRVTRRIVEITYQLISVVATKIIPLKIVINKLINNSHLQNFVDAVQQLVLLRQRFWVQIECHRCLVVVIEKLVKNARRQVFQLNQLIFGDNVVAGEPTAMWRNARGEHDGIVWWESIRRTIDFVFSKAENFFDSSQSRRLLLAGCEVNDYENCCRQNYACKHFLVAELRRSILEFPKNLISSLTRDPQDFGISGKTYADLSAWPPEAGAAVAGGAVPAADFFLCTRELILIGNFIRILSDFSVFKTRICENDIVVESLGMRGWAGWMLIRHRSCFGEHHVTCSKPFEISRKFFWEKSLSPKLVKKLCETDFRSIDSTVKRRFSTKACRLNDARSYTMSCVSIKEIHQKWFSVQTATRSSANSPRNLKFIKI